MTFGENFISVNKQIYATSTFDYTTCAVCTLLTEVDVSYEVDLPKPTSTAAVTDDIYWGLQVPGGRPVGVYTGTDTFTVIAD